MSISSLLGFNLFSKVDILLGLIIAAAALFYTGQILGSLLLGVGATLSFSMAREYFSPTRIKNTLSAGYEKVKESIFGPPSPHNHRRYPAAPERNPFNPHGRSHARGRNRPQEKRKMRLRANSF